MQVTAIIRRRIGELNVSRAEVARRAGIAPSTFSRVLSDQKPLYLEQLDAVCAVIGLDTGSVLDAADRASRERVRVSTSPAAALASAAPTPERATDTTATTGPKVREVQPQKRAAKRRGNPRGHTA